MLAKYILETHPECINLTAKCVVLLMARPLAGDLADALVNITTLWQEIDVHRSVLMQKLSDNCSQRGGSKNPATPPTTAHPITASAPSVDSVSDALILGAQKVQNYDLMEMIRIITLPPSIMCM